MAIRKDSVRIDLPLSIKGLKTPAEVRISLILKWSEEEVHRKYRYFAEKLSDGKHLYLERPGGLNKGCDFVIFVEDLILYKNGNDRPPSHKVLRHDLREKKCRLSSEHWRNLINAIESVHAMEDPVISSQMINKINKAGGMTFEQIQMLTKWMFIEQDLTYWNGRARNMLLDSIREIDREPAN